MDDIDMIYARLTDGKTFARAISFETPIGLRAACLKVFQQASANGSADLFHARQWINTETNQIEQWLLERLKKPSLSENDRTSIKQTAAKWRQDRMRGIKHGKKQIDVTGVYDPLELHVFDQYCGLDMDKMIDKSESWVAAGGYGGNETPDRSSTTLDDNGIETTSLKLKRITDRVVNVKVWLGRANPTSMDLSESCVGTSDDIERWHDIFNKCHAADKHAEALSVFSGRVASMGTKTPLERRADFKIINGDKND